RLLQRAENSNYGFCGNAWASAFEQIAELRGLIYLNQEKYVQAHEQFIEASAQSFLNGSRFVHYDSLLIYAFKKQYGPKELAHSIDTSWKGLVFQFDE